MIQIKSADSPRYRHVWYEHYCDTREISNDACQSVLNVFQVLRLVVRTLAKSYEATLCLDADGGLDVATTCQVACLNGGRKSFEECSTWDTNQTRGGGSMTP